MPDLVTPMSIAGLFTQILLGRNVTAEKTPTIRIAPTDPSAVAIYETAEGTIAGLCQCDIDLAHRAGAALCLIPADSRLSAAKFDSALLENFQEILNICAQLFAGKDHRRIKLRSVALTAAACPQEVAGLLKSPPWRMDVKLAINGYGSGRMAVLSVDKLS